MVANAKAPPRGSTAAAASLHRRTTSGGSPPAGAGTMLSFYTQMRQQVTECHPTLSSS